MATPLDLNAEFVKPQTSRVAFCRAMGDMWEDEAQGTAVSGVLGAACLMDVEAIRSCSHEKMVE